MADKEPTIEPIQGEPTRFFVHGSDPTPYLVDLEEYDGAAKCDCLDHSTRHSPKLERGARPKCDTDLTCKHVRAARSFVRLRRGVRV